jgi:hypothetical protein
MSAWEERITRETAPAIQVEHDLRYRIVAPLITTSTVWADLGCGTGVAAATALGDDRPPHAVLVDLHDDVVAAASRELGMPAARQIAGDLTAPDTLARIGEALLAVTGERIVTCFEVVEHLRSFVPLLEWSSELSQEADTTFVISVPNDAFWSIENPYHVGMWGEGAFEELSRLLPPRRSFFRQVMLSGSAMVGWGSSRERHEVPVEVGGESLVATHFVVAYGPRHDELRPAALAVQTDLPAQRRWERQRESNLAFSEAMVAEYRQVAEDHAAELDDLRAQTRRLRAELAASPARRLAVQLKRLADRTRARRGR